MNSNQSPAVEAASHPMVEKQTTPPISQAPADIAMTSVEDDLPTVRPSESDAIAAPKRPPTPHVPMASEKYPHLPRSTRAGLEQLDLITEVVWERIEKKLGKQKEVSFEDERRDDELSELKNKNEMLRNEADDLHSENDRLERQIKSLQESNAQLNEDVMQLARKVRERPAPPKLTESVPGSQQMQRPKAPTTAKRVIPGIGPVDPSSAKSTKKSSTSKWAPFSDDDDLEGDWGVDPDAPFVEFKMNRPPGYHYYEYYDNNVAIVNGDPLPPPTWLRSVVIPTKFFDNDHVD
jgi:hypothetical protein